MPSPDVLALTGLNQLNRWNVEAPVGTSVAVTYSFGSSRASYDTGARPEFAGFSGVQKGYIRQAFDTWGAASGISFVEVSDTTGGQIRLGQYDMSGMLNSVGNQVSGYAFYPSYQSTTINGATAYETVYDGIGGDIFMNANFYKGDNDAMAPGQRGYSIMLHEIGHAIGFKHPFEGTPTIRTDHDNGNFTVLSYNRANATIRLGSVDVEASRYYYGAKQLATVLNGDTLTRTGTNAGEWVLGTELNDVLIGRGGNDTLVGSLGNDFLNGGSGVNLHIGGEGNDKYRVYSSGDTVLEKTGEGNDRVYTSANFALSANAAVETLTTSSSGGTSNINLTGNNLSQTIIGNAGNNFLSSGAAGSADILRGLKGNDKYRVYNSNDTVLENASQGSDRIYSSVSYVLGAGASIETLTTHASSSSSSINLTGNKLSQTIIGNAGNNYLKGGGAGGADTFRGLGGDDKYRVYNSADTVLENAGQGNDRIYTSASFGLDAGSSVETLTTSSAGGSSNINLTGNALAQTIIGNAGDNLLSSGGAGGADTLRGLGGDDKYRVYNSADTVIELAGQGSDRVYASVNFGLDAGTSIETLTTHSSSGTAALKLTGNSLSQTIIGNAGDNYLSGGGAGGLDTLRGLGGDDKYRVYNMSDTVLENSGQGNDRVYTSSNYVLTDGAHIETLTTNSSKGSDNIALYGNELSQTIIGNAGANWIDGRGGSDILNGLGGNDIFAFTTVPGPGNLATIKGFNSADDQFEMDTFYFPAIVQAYGPLQQSLFKANAAGTATDSDDRIIYDTDGGQLYYDADGNGSDAAIQFALLTDSPAISFNDFRITFDFGDDVQFL